MQVVLLRMCRNFCPTFYLDLEHCAVPEVLGLPSEPYLALGGVFLTDLIANTFISYQTFEKNPLSPFPIPYPPVLLEV